MKTAVFILTAIVCVILILAVIQVNSVHTRLDYLEEVVSKMEHTTSADLEGHLQRILGEIVDGFTEAERGRLEEMADQHFRDIDDIMRKADDYVEMIEMQKRDRETRSGVERHELMP